VLVHMFLVGFLTAAAVLWASVFGYIGLLLALAARARRTGSGRSDDELGEVPEAVLITRSAVSETDLVAHCRARLQSYKLPVAFRFVNELPRNATGKVDRAALMRAAR